MELDNNYPKYGKLLTPDIKIHRQYFEEMISLIGIQVIYYAVNPGKKWTSYAELKTTHQAPELVGCLFTDHPSQQTMKKVNWISELQEGASLIHVPYDLHDLQVGCIFIIPSGLDNATGRVFRVTRLFSTMVYPASITCEVVPEYTDTFRDSEYDCTQTNFNVLAEEDAY